MSAILLAARQRENMRRETRLRCQVIAKDDGRLVGDRAEDLSVTGMCVRTKQPVALGTPVWVSFRIPGCHTYLDVEADVSRILWGRRRGERFPAFGLRFRELRPADCSLLATQLCGLAPPIPRRPVRRDYANTVRAISVSGAA